LQADIIPYNVYQLIKNKTFGIKFLSLDYFKNEVTDNFSELEMPVISALPRLTLKNSIREEKKITSAMCALL